MIFSVLPRKCFLSGSLPGWTEPKIAERRGGGRLVGQTQRPILFSLQSVCYFCYAYLLLSHETPSAIFPSCMQRTVLQVPHRLRPIPSLSFLKRDAAHPDAEWALAKSTRRPAPRELPARACTKPRPHSGRQTQESRRSSHSSKRITHGCGSSMIASCNIWRKRVCHRLLLRIVARFL